MTDKRQKNQLKLTFARLEEGEALAGPAEGIESEMATTEPENLSLIHI